MTDMPPESGATSRGHDLNPAKTALLKIAGIVVLAVAAVVFLYGLLLALAFGGQTPLASFLFSPFVVIVVLIAAGGLWLILHARKRDELYRQARIEPRRRA